MPLIGLSLSEIKKIEDSINISSTECFVLFDKKIFLSKEDSDLCRKKFIQRLNLNIALNFISTDTPHNSSINMPKIKAILRKKKFSANAECAYFINKLISNLQIKNSYPPPRPQGVAEEVNPDEECFKQSHPRADGGNEKMNSDEEYLILINLASDIFNGTDKNPTDKNTEYNNPMDILSAKKELYTRALLEYDEFNNLLKSYSMEFIMMKKIHAPLVPVDEAMYMLRLIDKMMRIV
jgi:hypothetical protein